MVQVDGLLGSFVPLLTEENYKSLVSVLVAEVAAQLEKAVLKTTFNRVSGSLFLWDFYLFIYSFLLQYSSFLILRTRLFIDVVYGLMEPLVIP